MRRALIFVAMSSQVSDISSIYKKVEIEIPASAVRKAFDKVSQNYARMANVPGFRRGNAPISVVRNRFKEDIRNDVLREVVPNYVRESLAEHNIAPLIEPEIGLEDADVKLDGSTDLKVIVQAEVMPTIEAPNFKGLEATRRVRPVTDEDMQSMIDGLLKNEQFNEPVEGRKSEEGDTITVDVKGHFVGDESTEPFEAQDLEITLGDANVEKTFAENLTGVEADDERTFTVEYPADFGSPAMAGKTAEYTAKVKSVGRVKTPEFNDEWVASRDEEGVKTADEMRGKIRADLEKYATQESDMRLRDELLNKLIDASDVEVPPSLIDVQARNLTNNFGNEMAQRGMDVRSAKPEFWQRVYESMIPQATREVRGALLLDAIVRAENLDATDDEISKEIEEIANQTRQTPDEIRIALESNNQLAQISERLRNRKAIEAVVEHATISEGEWIDEEAEQTELSDAMSALSETETESGEQSAEAKTESGEQSAETETAATEETEAKAAVKTKSKGKAKANAEANSETGENNSAEETKDKPKKRSRKKADENEGE